MLRRKKGRNERAFPEPKATLTYSFSFVHLCMGVFILCVYAIVCVCLCMCVRALSSHSIRNAHIVHSRLFGVDVAHGQTPIVDICRCAIQYSNRHVKRHAAVYVSNGIVGERSCSRSYD